MRSRRSFFPDRKEGGSLSLPFPESDTATRRPAALQAADDTSGDTAGSEALPARSPQACRRSLWLGLRLPEFVLELHFEPAGRSLAAAVIEERQGQLTVKALSTEAKNRGLARGMALAAALALVPELRLREFDAGFVEAGLNRAAGVAESCTATVCLEPPDALLLEIGGSLRLFGGLGPLRQRITKDFAAIGHRVVAAVAPTPQAAVWLSGWRPGIVVRRKRDLAGALRNLPLDRLDWPSDVMLRLEAIGLGTLGDCRRLPRAGFARRFGPVRLLALDRAYGVSPDPRISYRAPMSFSDELELSGEVNDKALLLEACEVLLERLHRFLLARQSAVQVLRIKFYPLRGKATLLEVRFGAAGFGVSHWLDLLRVKLERLELSAPAIVVELQTNAIQPLVVHPGRLPFSPERDPVDSGMTLALLVERLRVRLGRSAVYGLDALEEFRPEFAIRFISPETPEKTRHCAAFSPWHELREIPDGAVALQSAGRLLLQRPLWILKEPQQLEVHENLPCHQGKLHIFSGPERIETGWWDGRDTARDYYVAAGTNGACLWVFRERLYRRGEWYLHGLFG